MTLYGLRVSKGLSRSDLAQKLNVTSETILAWEMGNPMPAQQLEPLAIALETTPDEIRNLKQLANPEILLPQEKQIVPITCPRCGKRELAFVTEYHQAIGLRILAIVFGALCLFSAIANLSILTAKNDNNFGGVIIFGIACLVVKAIQYAVESKTHVQVICKECGNLWLLN